MGLALTLIAMTWRSAVAVECEWTVSAPIMQVRSWYVPGDPYLGLYMRDVDGAVENTGAQFAQGGENFSGTRILIFRRDTCEVVAQLPVPENARLDPAWFDAADIPIPFDFHHEYGGYIGYAYTLSGVVTEEFFHLGVSGETLHSEAATHTVAAGIPRTGLQLREAFNAYVRARPISTFRATSQDGNSADRSNANISRNTPEAWPTHSTTQSRYKYGLGALILLVVIGYLVLRRRG